MSFGLLPDFLTSFRPRNHLWTTTRPLHPASHAGGGHSAPSPTTELRVPHPRDHRDPTVTDRVPRTHHDPMVMLTVAHGSLNEPGRIRRELRLQAAAPTAAEAAEAHRRTDTAIHEGRRAVQPPDRAVPRTRASTANTSRLRRRASCASSRSAASKRSART